MFRFMWWPIRSKRKPSTLYCFAQVRTESMSSFSIMLCSDAVFAQQLDMREARGGERAQVPHPVGGEPRKRLARPAQGFRNGGVVDAEVPHVELVQRDVLRSVHGRLPQGIPSARLQRRAGEVDDMAPLAVARQTD